MRKFTSFLCSKRYSCLIITLLFFFFATGVGILPGDAQAGDVAIKKIENAQVSDVSDSGEISQLFHMSMGNKKGDQLRSEMLPKLIGKVVEWTLPVYKITTAKNNSLRVQTKSIKGKHVGTFIMISPRNAQEAEYLKGLTKGATIHLKARSQARRYIIC